MAVNHKEVVVIVSIISLICAAYMTALFYKSKKNPMMFYFSLSAMFLNILTMCGFRYGFDWNKAPIELCYLQALTLQFISFMIAACGFIYTLQTYRLLVLRLRHELTDSQWKKFYYGFIIIYPVVGTAIVSILAIQQRAVQVREFNCDVVYPIWIRVFFHSGPNIILCIAGTYLFGYATILVISKLHRFNSKSFQTRLSSPLDNATAATTVESLEQQQQQSADHIIDIHSDPSLFDEIDDKRLEVQKDHAVIQASTTIDITNNDNDFSVVAPGTRASSTLQVKVYNYRYNITLNIAIRMVIFICAYIIVNIGVSLASINSIVTNTPVNPHVNISDIIGSSIGILLFLIFGTTSSVI